VAEVIARNSVSHLLSLPALHELMLQQARPEQLTSLRTVIVAGETCPAQLVERHFEALSRAALFNEYGATEATVWSSVHDCQRLAEPRPVPIGRPVMNTQIYVLDRQFQPVPVGVIGEIHIGGEGVARGYLNHLDLTAERFVPDPFSRTPGARLYRTSDMARFVTNGEIEFVGRMDQQVKVRGFRIEPGEIETVLGQHPGVLDAVVVAREDTSGGKRLIAYVVVREEPPPATSALRDYLRKRLPEYMVPASFLVLESLPLTATGKIDRNALPVDEIAVVTSENYLAPRTAVEKVLAGIFSEMLSLERFGVDESFFDLGGHSLLATQVLSRVREAFQVELPLRKLFKTPTVAGLAADILEDEGQRDRIEHTAELLLKLTSLSDKEEIGR